MDLKKLGYDFKEKYLQISNHRMHYIDEGEGEEPIVMLHGNPSWSFYYRFLITHLRNRYRVIVPDHIGCGLSDKPDINHYNYQLSQRVSDLEALLEKLGIHKNITLVLHDWGGMIGMAYAVAHPEKIKRIIILNTAAFHLPQSKSFPAILKFARSPLGAWLILNCNAFARGTAWIGCQKKRMPKILRDAYCAPYDSAQHRVALLQFVKDIPLQPDHPTYAQVSHVENNLHRLSHIPMLICWGMKDNIFDHHFLQRWEHYFPDATIFRFNEAGHYVLEDEYEEILKKINTFLSVSVKSKEKVV